MSSRLSKRLATACHSSRFPRRRLARSSSSSSSSHSSHSHSCTARPGPGLGRPRPRGCPPHVGKPLDQPASSWITPPFATRMAEKQQQQQMMMTNIDLINACDAFPYPEKNPAAYKAQMSTLWTLIWRDDDGDGDGADFPIGYMPDWVLTAVEAAPEPVRGALVIDRHLRTVRLFHEAATEPERTALAGRLAAHWRAGLAFDTLRGWRDELFPVFGRKGELLFSVERAAMGLFGNNRYGVHMTAYTTPTSTSSREDGGGDGDGGDKTAYPFRIWVSKRAANKQTYPGMLDNTVAGGLMTGEPSPLEAMVREADEEASLGEDQMRRDVRAVGTITYVSITDGPRSGGEAGLVYPECQWVYDLELPAGVVPRPRDGEVESFELCSVETVRQQLAQGLWKPNCAVVMIDFFMRHGVYTPADEPHFEEIRSRMHRQLPFPGPGPLPGGWGPIY